MTTAPYDLLIVGGGINGCAIAREAALNGLSVLLVERDDLASHTSSASSKLIHGGIRYLELYDFRMVAEALAERERLLKAAPHIIRPIPFVLPHVDAVRPWWLVRAGLLLYDLLGGRKLVPRSRGLGAADAMYRAPLKGSGRGFVYSDAVVDDSRLTILNAVDAAENGADICTRTAFIGAQPTPGGWTATLGGGEQVHARAIVNAAGPWAAQVLAATGTNSGARLRLVKGSHIVVPRLYAGDHAYILQQPDRRVVFALPWQGQTMIGTTDVPVHRPEDARIDGDEIAYLCAAANRHFRTQIASGDVTATWSGVRPLYDDGAGEARGISRDFVLEIGSRTPPLLNVFGGKITTARHLAERAVAQFAPLLGHAARTVTRDRPLPGGDLADPGAFLSEVRTRWPFLGDARAERMAAAYGTRLATMLAGITDAAGMGADLGAGITAVEARWMREREFAWHPDDALDRRSKLGFGMSAADRAAFARAWAALQQPGQRIH